MELCSSFDSDDSDASEMDGALGGVEESSGDEWDKRMDTSNGERPSGFWLLQVGRVVQKTLAVTGYTFKLMRDDQPVGNQIIPLSCTHPIDLSSLELNVTDRRALFELRAILGVRESRVHFSFLAQRIKSGIENPDYPKQWLKAVAEDILKRKLQCVEYIHIRAELEDAHVSPSILGILDSFADRLGQSPGKFATIANKLFFLLKLADYDWAKLSDLAQRFDSGSISIWCDYPNACFTVTPNESKTISEYLKTQVESRSRESKGKRKRLAEKEIAVLNKICEHISENARRKYIKQRYTVPEYLNGRLFILTEARRPLAPAPEIKVRSEDSVDVMTALGIGAVLNLLYQISLSAENHYLFAGGLLYLLTFYWPIRAESVLQMRCKDVLKLYRVRDVHTFYPLAVFNTKSQKFDQHGTRITEGNYTYIAVPLFLVMAIRRFIDYRMGTDGRLGCEEFLFVDSEGFRLTDPRTSILHFLRKAGLSAKQIANVRNKGGRSTASANMLVGQESSVNGKPAGWEHSSRVILSNYTDGKHNFLLNLKLRWYQAKSMHSIYGPKCPPFFASLAQKNIDEILGETGRAYDHTYDPTLLNNTEAPHERLESKLWSVDISR